MTQRDGMVVAVAGALALATQTLLFRVFLTAFEGHELAVGLFFASWLAWVAVGAALGRMGPGRRIMNDALFDLLPLAWLPAFLLHAELLRAVRAFCGVEAYELFPWFKLVGGTLLLNAPAALLTGLVFTWACRRGTLAPAGVFALEALGGFAGAALTTFLLWRGLPDETVFCIAGLAACAPALLARRLVRRRPDEGGNRRAVWVAAVAAAVLALAWLADWTGDWQRINDLRQWQRLLPAKSFHGSFSTPQAHYLYGERRGGFVALSAGGIVENVPNEERTAEIAALNLAQKPDARRVLVIGADAYALCRLLTALPEIERVTWLHPDPQYPAALRRILPPQLAAPGNRLIAPARDGRAQLAADPTCYDLAIVNIPAANTLPQNRFLTAEFFALLKRRLAPDGVVGMRLQGGENYLGPELVAQGAAALATLQPFFPCVALKPGEDTWLFASAVPCVTADGSLLAQRLAGLAPLAQLFPPERVAQLFPADRMREQLARYRGALRADDPRELRNRDDRPQTLLTSLELLFKQTGMDTATFAGWRRAFPGWRILLLGALAATLYIVLRMAYGAAQRQPLPAGAAPDHTYRHGLVDGLLLLTTGFIGMAFCVALLMAFQFCHGALFLATGFISALFMLGLCAGAVAGNWCLRRWPGQRNPLLVTLLLLQTALLSQSASLAAEAPAVVYFLLAALGGFLQGLYAPWVAVRWQGVVGATVAGARLEICDSLGGALGGLLSAVLLLPFMGLPAALALLCVLALSNLPAAFPWQETSWRIQPPAPSRRLAQAAGYLVLAALILADGFYITAPPSMSHQFRMADEAAGTLEMLPTREPDHSPRIRELIRQGRLSEHEALFYHPLGATNQPPAAAPAPQP